MLFTTFNKLHKNHACTEGYQTGSVFEEKWQTEQFLELLNK